MSPRLSTTSKAKSLSKPHLALANVLLQKSATFAVGLQVSRSKTVQQALDLYNEGPASEVEQLDGWMYHSI